MSRSPPASTSIFSMIAEWGRVVVAAAEAQRALADDEHSARGNRAAGITCQEERAGTGLGHSSGHGQRVAEPKLRAAGHAYAAAARADGESAANADGAARILQDSTVEDEFAAGVAGRADRAGLTAIGQHCRRERAAGDSRRAAVAVARAERQCAAPLLDEATAAADGKAAKIGALNNSVAAAKGQRAIVYDDIQ